jgi:hypothetical protein
MPSRLPRVSSFSIPLLKKQRIIDEPRAAIIAPQPKFYT